MSPFPVICSVRCTIATSCRFLLLLTTIKDALAAITRELNSPWGKNFFPALTPVFVELENARYTVKTNACCKKTDVKKSSWSWIIITTHAYVCTRSARSGYGAAYTTDNWKRRHSGLGVNGKLTLYSSFTS